MIRAEMDQAMARVLFDLALCSHVPAPGYEPKGRSGATKSVMLSGGDVGADFYAARYYTARDDHDRNRWYQAAKDELASLRNHGGAGRLRPAGETSDQTVARMLAECAGLPADQVQSTRFAMSPTTVRKHRRSAGLDVETGHPLPTVGQRDEDAARALLAEGKSVRYVAMKTGISKSTLHRWTKEDIAA